MRWRVAKKVALAFSCGPDCHRMGQIEAAERKFCKTLRRSARRQARYSSHIQHWSVEYHKRCGYTILTYKGSSTSLQLWNGFRWTWPIPEVGDQHTPT